ncbi:MAG: hypothetical protein ACTSQE_15550 [Candidatus Heimdallarchaeaceae archaeon]
MNKKTIYFKHLFSKFLILFLICILINVGPKNIMANNLYSTDSSTNLNTTLKLSNSYSTFGNPVLDPLEPASNETATVTMAINDPDGIRNATLFWQYVSLNDTLYETTMNKDKLLIVDETKFERKGYITDTGVETTDPTDWRFGEFIFIAEEGEIITEIDTSIIRKGQNFLVYVLIEAYNITSDQWEERYKDGDVGGVVEVDPYPANYQSNESVYGYRIYAISYIGNHPFVDDPEFDYLYMYREVYSADILPPNLTSNTPTWVNYNITAFDLLNNSMTSETYEFLMDWEPEITIHELPPAINADTGYVLNITVTDYDGVGTINDSSVVVYYRLEGETEYQTKNLSHIADISSTQASYRTTIETSDIGDVETNLFFMVNASDIVDLQKGREGTSGLKSVIFDNLNPRVTGITVYGGISIPGIENVTLINSEVNITAEFTDPAGIKEVYILYSMPNGTEPIRIEMINTTLIEQGTTPATFYATLPATNETAFVEYYFETHDFFGNVGNTSVNFYYADGLSPILDKILVYPPVISNITNVRVLFNASDYSNLKTSVIWYSFDGGTTWSNAVAYTIDYNDFIDYLETFVAVDLPFLIEDNDTSYLTLNVARGGGVNAAKLTIGITHERSTDLRLWLILDDGRRFLIFDRETRSTSFNIEIDLLNLGLVESDFTDANFTLEIADYSDLYSGSITAFEIELRDYSIPWGYQYISTIPNSSIDTTVQFYITLTDNLDNAKNTSIFSYYSDGLPPNISVIPITSPVNLEGAYTIEVMANITDNGEILCAEAYYRFSELDDWMIISMLYDSLSDLYYATISIPTSSGNLTYKVRAYDIAGFSSESDIYIVEFSNGLAPIITLLDTPYPTVLNIEKTKTFRIRANVSDDGILKSVQIYYKFESESEWVIEDMVLDNETFYYFDIELPKKSGVLIFKITATDDLNLVTETIVYEVNYEIVREINPLTYVIPLASLGGIGIIAAIMIFLKKKGLIFKG